MLEQHWLRRLEELPYLLDVEVNGVSRRQQSFRKRSAFIEDTTSPSLLRCQ